MMSAVTPLLPVTDAAVGMYAAATQTYVFTVADKRNINTDKILTPLVFLRIAATPSSWLCVLVLLARGE